MRRPMHSTAERGPRAAPRCGAARRGGRYPVWAHDGSVAAARRLRCDARSTRAAAVPPSAALNAPLTSRRPRRSVACCAGLPLASLRFSPPHKSPTPDTAHRAETLVVFDDACHGGAAKPWSGVRRQRHCAALRSAGLVAARAQRALRSSDSPRLFERSERSERSEFLGGPRDRAPEGSRPAGPTAAHERRRIPARGFASLCLSNSSRDFTE